MWTYQPDVVSPPGETLLETLEALGMTQADLAERTARPRKTINEIVKGKAPITPETALQFEKVLGVPARFWNSREAAYRDFLARQVERERLQKEIGRLANVPVDALERRKWIPPAASRVDRLRNVYSFFGVASWEALESSSLQVLYRCSPKLKADKIALAAWLRKGWLEAQQIVTEPYSEQAFEKALLAIRALTAEIASRHSSGIEATTLVKRLQGICAPAGVAVIFVPELPKTRAFGATHWASSLKVIVQLSNRYKRDDIFWFTFFHETAHILKHGKKETFIECGGAKDSKEAAADRFATDFLIPSDQWREFIASESRREKEIREFARKLNIAPGIVVGRLQHERLLPQNQLNDLKVKIQTAG